MPNEFRCGVSADDEGLYNQLTSCVILDWTTGLFGYLIFLGAAILACHLKLCLDQLHLLLVFLLKVCHSLLLLIQQSLPLDVWTTDRTLTVTFLIEIQSPQCLCCSYSLKLQDQFLIQVHCRPTPYFSILYKRHMLSAFHNNVDKHTMEEPR